MSVAELNIAPRLNGRAPSTATVEFVRELVPADLALLASERENPVKPPALKQLRDRHHALARCLAQGMTHGEASAVTGYDLPRISILKSDPTFRELVAHYLSQEDALAADYSERATTLALTAMNRLQEALEDEETPLSDSMALEIAKFASDRTGHAPIAKSVNVNLNSDLGNRMAAARKRLANSGA